MTLSFNTEREANDFAKLIQAQLPDYANVDVVMAPDETYSLALIERGVFAGFLKREA